MYEEEWDEYSRQWEEETKGAFSFLGYEWAGEEFAKRITENWLVPYLRPGAVAAEIGSGGGRFSSLALPLCKELHLADISAEMLKRLRERFAGANNVFYHKLDGKSMTTVPTCDLVFSFDVFVHLEPEDIYMYLTEIHRRLRPGGKGILHFSNILTEAGWNKFVQDYPFSVGGSRKKFKFSCMTLDIMRRFLDSLAFQIEVLRDRQRDAVTVFVKR